MKRIVTFIVFLIISAVILTACSPVDILKNVFGDGKPDPEDCVHEYSEWIVVREADCLNESYHTRTCAICDNLQEMYLPKSDSHSYVDLPEVEPTCQEEGLSAGVKCSVCGYKLVSQTKIDKVPHYYENGNCKFCGLVDISSQGLEYGYDKDGLVVVGIGTCTDTDIIIPDSIEGTPVVSIGYSAFSYNENITSVVLPKNLKKIEMSAFSNCKNLKTVEFKENIEIIEDYAFFYCYDLESAIFTSDIKEFGEAVFYECISLKEVKFAGEFTDSIPRHAFYKCSSLVYINIPEPVQRIEEEAFLGCTSLESIFIPNSVESICNNSFQDCKNLKLVILSENLGWIQPYTFSGCLSLEEITLTENIKTIASGAFALCTSLRTINIPDSVTRIENWAFRTCGALTEITIPKSVTFIGEECFSSAVGTGTTVINYEGTMEEWNAISKDGFDKGSYLEIIKCSDGEINLK